MARKRKPDGRNGGSYYAGCKSGKDIKRRAERHPNCTDSYAGSRHWIVESERGHVAIPQHSNHDLPAGTRNSILTQLAMIGLALALIALCALAALAALAACG